MKNSYLVFLLVIGMFLVPSCAGNVEPAETPQAATITAAPGSEDVEAVIAQLERDWAAAIVAKDVAALERLLADDFGGTSANGQRYTKTEAIEDVKTGKYLAESIDLGGIAVRAFGDTAVVTFDQTEKSKFQGEECSGQYNFTDVWIKRNGEWRAVASHGSRGWSL
jgi:ketosteroid isomerase-like protein